MILVTGGTGMLGAHVLYHLTLKNDTIRAIYRTEEKLAAVKKVFSYYTSDVTTFFKKIEWIQADITEVPSLFPCFEQVTQVYHIAALVSFDPKDYRRMRQVNIDGTANIVNLCIEQQIEKLCFVSSIAAVGDAINGAIITEENEWIESGDNHGYAITKYGAEMEVWRASQEGVPVVVVNPGVILGGGFWKEGSGKLVDQVANGFRFYTEGVTGFVGVEDVAKSMLLLMQSPIINQRFILVAENKSFKEVLLTIADALQVKRPSRKIGKLLTEIFWRVDWVLTKLTGKTPLLTKNSARSSHHKSYYSSAKIEEMLPFQFSKIDEVIQTLAHQYKS